MDEIKGYLVDNGVKRNWLAKKLKISDSYLSLILSGDRVPPEWFGNKINKIMNKENKNGEESMGS
jgi:ribosome-binding protein aMBF1 (putative translation factor)